MNMKDILKERLSKEELSKVPRAFDVVGDVAIIEIPFELKHRKMDIAEALLKVNKHVKTVCDKYGERSGDYRLNELEILIGKSTVTEHKENNCRFRVDLSKAYFSARESTERLRIGRMIKPGENVLVMFSGVCPSPITYARMQKKIGSAYGVELNPDAHRYAEENVRLNKVKDKVIPLCGNVRELCPKLGKKFDRITMPLPKGAYEFLDTVFEVAAMGCVVHFYYYDRQEALYGKALEYVENAAKKAKRKIKILDKRKVLPYGPRIWKVCVEFMVLD